VSPRKETGAEQLRRIVAVLNGSRESALDPFTAEELLRIVRACWTSPWDIYPDNLTFDELKFAAKHSKLSAACKRRLDSAFR
jgi:hypothetical protein